MVLWTKLPTVSTNQISTTVNLKLMSMNLISASANLKSMSVNLESMSVNIFQPVRSYEFKWLLPDPVHHALATNCSA